VKSGMDTRRVIKMGKEHIEICNLPIFIAERSRHAAFHLRSSFLVEYPG